MQRLLKEPLVYFLLAGAAIFVLGGLAPANDADYRIEITAAERARLSDQWQAQMGRVPTAQELEGLIEQWIREEIYYREALRLGLDNNDTIIRRRLAQKLTFLTEDVATGSEPTRAQLQQFYQEHSDRYTVPERFSFRHRYFSSDRRADAEADARAALTAAEAGDGSAAGDPFMLQMAYVQRSEREIAELFGREFAATLRELPAGGGWRGPIASAYGWHIVIVEQRVAARLPGYDEVARRVAIDYQQDLRRQANENYYQSLRDRYEIVSS